MNLNTKIHLVLNQFKELGNFDYVGINSSHPSEIYQLLSQTNTKDIILWTVDVWRYNKELKDILKNFLNKRIIVIAPVYDNQKINQNHYELSLPLYYWARYKSEKQFAPKSTNLDYGFGCLNNRPAAQRLLLGYQLFKNNLLDKIIYTQNSIDAKDQNVDYNKIFDLLGNYVNDETFYHFLKLLPIEWKQEKILCEDYLVEHEAEQFSYCNIITETEVQDWPYNNFVNRPVVTEKTWKPFITGQIPIFFAACGHLKYLQSLGFEIFEDLYPKNFDNFDLESKITAITRIVNQGKNFIKEYYFDKTKEIQHNYDLVMSDKVEKLILERAFNFINE